MNSLRFIRYSQKLQPILPDSAYVADPLVDSDWTNLLVKGICMMTRSAYTPEPRTPLLFRLGSARLSEDEALAARVERVIRSRAGNRIRDLQVDVQGDIVAVSGRADTYYAKQIAIHAALFELEPRTRQNQIEVI